VSLSHGATLTLGTDDEVGAASFLGADSSKTGANASANGTVSVFGLNGSDGNAVSVTDSGLSAAGTATIGPLVGTGASLQIGQPYVPSGLVTVNGNVSLDPQTQLTMYINQSGNNAGSDYSMLSVNGSATLGGTLVLSGMGSAGGCPSLTPGDSATLITASGTLSGKFAGLPDGAALTMSCWTGIAGPVLQINYIGHSVTATVLSPPTNQSAPTISGNNQQGQTLTLQHGLWNESASVPVAVSYLDQWERCDAYGSSCQPIAGATGTTYTLTSNDAWHAIRVQENAVNAAGESSPAISSATMMIVPLPPANASPPTISGLPEQDHTLTGALGSWTNGPTTYSYQWQRCAPACVDIPGAVTSSYTLGAQDVGTSVRFVVSATNAAGSTRAASDQLGPVFANGQDIQAALAAVLRPTGAGATIGALLKHDGYKFSFKAHSAGTLVISWYESGWSQRRSSRSRRQPLTASVRFTFSTAATGQVTIKLTAWGRWLLYHSPRPERPRARSGCNAGDAQRGRGRANAMSALLWSSSVWDGLARHSGSWGRSRPGSTGRRSRSPGGVSGPFWRCCCCTPTGASPLKT
jgi:hypothetical protein